MTWVEKGSEKDKGVPVLEGWMGLKVDKMGKFPVCTVSGWPVPGPHIPCVQCVLAPAPCCVPSVQLVWLPSWLPQLLHSFQWINSHPLPVSQSRDREHFKHRGRCYGSESGVWCGPVAPGHMQGTTLGLMGQGARRSLPSSQTASWTILSEPLKMENRRMGTSSNHE